MPSIVGNLKINSVGSSGVLHFGDNFYQSPKSSTKTFSGSGAFNTGDLLRTNNGINTTNTMDADVKDSSNTLLR